MSTESETLLARYKQVEREADGFGRIIGVRRLKPSEQTKLTGMTPELSGTEEAPEFDPVTKTPTGRTMSISRRMPLLITASVCEINDQKIPFPYTRGELDVIFDRLDEEGLTAASKGFLRLLETQRSHTPEQSKEEAKNSSGTPGSE